MKIKQPNSDNALESLWRQIDLARGRLANCATSNHDVTAVLYISSLIITPNVVFNGARLLDEISNLTNLSPRCICAIRTTTPQYFARAPYMRTWQQRSIDFLRTRCYVIVYSPAHEFLNHAKFFMYYHVCFSENVVHFGNFYGSTNLTQRGLGNPRNRGNYEEFVVRNGIKYSLSRRDRFYLNEVLDLVKHKASLYTDPKYLAQFVSDHQDLLEGLLHQGLRSNPGFLMRELYEKYIDLLTIYNQTFALLGEIPGKKVTEEIARDLVSMRPPTNPFELEMMFIDPKYAEQVLEDLGLSENALKELIIESENAIRNASLSIREKYQPVIGKIEDYIDEKETVFLSFLKRNSKMHIENLKKTISLNEYGSSTHEHSF